MYENGGELSAARSAPFLCTAAAEGDFPVLRLLHECGVEADMSGE